MCYFLWQNNSPRKAICRCEYVKDLEAGLSRIIQAGPKDNLIYPCKREADGCLTTDRGGGEIKTEAEVGVM